MIRNRYVAAVVIPTLMAACSTVQHVAPPPVPLDEPTTAAQLVVEPAKPIDVVAVPEPLPLPAQLKPLVEVVPLPLERVDPRERVAKANDEARVSPTRDGYLNAIQVWPYAEGALYQVYASPGRVTDIMLQEGEELISVSAGDTVRWIVGDTTSATGAAQRVHVLVKPIRASLKTNLVITTNRRIYLLELTATPQTWMASVSWNYPGDQLAMLKRNAARAEAAEPVSQGIALERLRFRYDISGDRPSWRPLRAFDDGERVYIEFPRGIAQGELPPLFVIGSSGAGELVNYRYRAPYYIVDRLFGAAELRLGADKAQMVRIGRSDVGGKRWIVSAKVDPETLTLRARPKPVTRLNRRMLIGVIVVAICLVLGVTAWSLRSNLRLADVRPELHNVQHVPRVEGLERLPPDYSKIPPPKAPESAEPAVPILGRPVPGDLGEAMVRAEHRAEPASDPARAERAAREREIEDAAKAPIFFTSSSRSGSSLAAARASAAAGESSEPLAEKGQSNKAGASQNPPATGSKGSSVSLYRVETPTSPYQIMAGTVISAALITGINSDLPGMILATVTEPVYDTKLGRHLLIPQGTRLIGEYDSQVAFGQRRVLLVWNRLVFPDASSLTLDRIPGVDTAGNAGLEDGVDRHWQQLLAGAALSTLIGVAAELAAPDRIDGRSQVIVTAQQSVQDSINQVGQELTRRNLNVQPTLTVRPGYPVRVIVSKDLVLRPYQPLFVQRSTP